MKDSMTDRMAEIESGSTDAAATSRLDQIRASISGELEAGSGTDAGAGDADRQLEAGSGEDEQKPSGSSRRVTAEPQTSDADDSANTDDILADAEKYMRDED